MMDQVHWAFGIKKYSSYDEFVRDVTDKCESIAPGDHDWNPDEYVCTGPLAIEFELLYKEPPEMIYFEITEKKEDLNQGTLLYRLNNLSYDYFTTDDHKFFEGLGELIDGKMYLLTGS